MQKAKQLVCFKDLLRSYSASANAVAQWSFLLKTAQEKDRSHKSGEQPEVPTAITDKRHNLTVDSVALHVECDICKLLRVMAIKAEK